MELENENEILRNELNITENQQMMTEHGGHLSGFRKDFAEYN